MHMITRYTLVCGCNIKVSYSQTITIFHGVQLAQRLMQSDWLGMQYKFAVTAQDPANIPEHINLCVFR